MSDRERFAWLALAMTFIGFCAACALGGRAYGESRTAYARGYAAAVDSVRANGRDLMDLRDSFLSGYTVGALREAQGIHDHTNEMACAYRAWSADSARWWAVR